MTDNPTALLVSRLRQSAQVQRMTRGVPDVSNGDLYDEAAATITAKDAEIAAQAETIERFEEGRVYPPAIADPFARHSMVLKMDYCDGLIERKVRGYNVAGPYYITEKGRAALAKES